MTFTEKLETAVKQAVSVLCVGLDPNLALIPETIKKNYPSPAEQVMVFCKQVIESTSASCAAYKPNMAFFEALGSKGIAALEEILSYIPSDKIVIADAKRGDIHSTAEHYKITFFDSFNADAVTLNPLMGFETLDAFLEDTRKGVYVLALTSNPGAADFLKKPFQGHDMMAQYIAGHLSEKSRTSKTHLGMVIGATQSGEISSVIDMHPEGSLLIPGIGAQGGSVNELAEALRNHRGIPLINSSRGIIYAGNQMEKWAEGVEQKAQEMKQKLNQITARYV